MRSCRKKTGPGETSLIHNARNSTTGNHKGRLSKIQVRSRMVFQVRILEPVAVASPVSNNWLLTVPLLGQENPAPRPIGVLLIEGLRSSSVTISCVQDAVNSINCDSKLSENFSPEAIPIPDLTLVKHGSCHQPRRESLLGSYLRWQRKAAKNVPSLGNNFHFRTRFRQ
jgi:hypothetical protein